MINSKLLRRLEKLEVLVAEQLRPPLEIVIDFVEVGGEITESITLPSGERKWQGGARPSMPARNRFARKRS